MPEFSGVEVEVRGEVDIDFEVFCGTCGAGLCNQTDTRKSYGRGILQVTVDACQKCMDRVRDEAYDELQSRLVELEDLIAVLQEENHD
jgi:hypothetical protein